MANGKRRIRLAKAKLKVDKAAAVKIPAKRKPKAK